MIWDMIQQWKIEETERKVEKLSSENRNVEFQSEISLKRLEQLALATQAVWSFLKEKHHLDDQDLLLRMEEIDLRDGVRDGKSAAIMANCPSCHRKMSSKMKQCVYCGTENAQFNPFSG